MKVVEDSMAFVTKDGQKLYSLIDLLVWLLSCDESSFRYHVNGEANHFYNWINDVLGYKDLASNIKNVTDKEEMIKILKKYIFSQNANKLRKEGETEVLLEFVKIFIKE